MTPRNRMVDFMERKSSVGALLWMSAALAAPLWSPAKDSPVRVELSCRIATEPCLSSGSILLVEIQNPGGETVCQQFARPGSVVRFKRLWPGIFVACISDKSGRRRCESVDLYPPPGRRKARLSMQLQPPVSVPEAERLCLVNKWSLAVPEEARRQFDKHRKAQIRGKATEAIRHLERALKIYPDYPEALNNLGTLSHLAGDRARALTLFQRLTEIAPEFYAGWLNLGVTLLVTGDPRRALQAEMRALKLRPDDPFVVYQVGLCYYTLGEYEEAKTHFNRIIELDPCSATYPHVYLAHIALAKNEPDKAESLIRQALELHPYSPWPPEMQEVVDRISKMVPGYPFPN